MFSLHVDTARSWRGGQNQTLLTVLGLAAMGQRAALVAHPDGELRRRAAEGLELVPLAPRTEMDLSAGWRLSRVVARLGPDVIHAHDPHAVAMASLALSLGSFEPRPPLVASRRVDFHLKRNAFSRWKYRQVDCFICASDAIRTMLRGDGVAAPHVVTIHEGIDVDHVAAAPPANVHAEFWLPRETPVVGNAAALVPHKGQRYLVDAAALVRRDEPDTRFIIAGEGELRPALEAQIRTHHLEKHVLLVGFRPDVLSLLKGFDLFVMSSVTEGLGTSLLDAMAGGVAIVATRVGGIPEVVVDGESGRLVPPRDPQALGTAIVELLRDAPQRRRLAQGGAERVRRRFTARRMVEQTLEVYGRLVGRPRATDTVRLAARD